MQKKSAGILLYRFSNCKPQVLLVHPGGPFWARKDLESWSIPKGEFEENEDPLSVAKREFEEETGTAIVGTFVELEPVRQPSGKTVYAWATEGDCDVANLKSNMFSMEWPPKSGKSQDFPEVDRGEWFNLKMARKKILKGQRPLLDQLVRLLDLSETWSHESAEVPEQQQLF